ncbi:DNA-binding MurR/RpiR family transcriptional regulator [Sporomusaceae bacterium BoRhaA]|uniref:MurR/RpiR family transcriptional regulator n=1 Tax=Pelorhabdus rhamnosifermentans TaxID=2772457 RepID=UPI001C063F04|nr:MurR/RpiR family transcriptional regulator [Pelorhabdus rhamnosifermentans]MBU2699559.1 DNA-binding MurR/RpiR family transcriptional regulator [Pelorhabdus rhamnosifermentans]
MDKNDVLQDFKKNYQQLTESQKMIGQYVFDHYQEIVFLSANDLGERVGVSDATIIRFARSIGFEGFAELKKHIRKGLKNFSSPDKRLSENFEALDEDVSWKVGRKDFENLEYFLAHLEMEKIHQATAMMEQAETIYIMGMGSSGILVDLLTLHLRRMGFRVTAISEGGVVNVEKILPMTNEDLLITCSFPRYSKPTYHTLLFANQKRTKTITITDSHFSSMSIQSDIVFSLQIDNFTFFNSYVVPMELCHILIMDLLEKNKMEIHTKLKNNVQSLEVFDTKL